VADRIEVTIESETIDIGVTPNPPIEIEIGPISGTISTGGSTFTLTDDAVLDLAKENRVNADRGSALGISTTDRDALALLDIPSSFSDLTGTLATSQLPAGVSIYPLYKDGDNLSWTSREFAPGAVVVHGTGAAQAVYICILSTHNINDSVTEPGTGTGWATYWQRLAYTNRAADSDTTVTGLSLSGTTLTLTDSANNTTTVELTGLGSGGGSGSEVTGLTLSNANVLTLAQTSGGSQTVDLSSLVGSNTTVSTLTLGSNNVLTLTDSASATVTVDLSSLAGGTPAAAPATLSSVGTFTPSNSAAVDTGIATDDLTDVVHFDIQYTRNDANTRMSHTVKKSNLEGATSSDPYHLQLQGSGTDRVDLYVSSGNLFSASTASTTSIITVFQTWTVSNLTGGKGDKGDKGDPGEDGDDATLDLATLLSTLGIPSYATANRTQIIARHPTNNTGWVYTDVPAVMSMRLSDANVLTLTQTPGANVDVDLSALAGGGGAFDSADIDLDIDGIYALDSDSRAKLSAIDTEETLTWASGLGDTAFAMALPAQFTTTPDDVDFQSTAFTVTQGQRSGCWIRVPKGYDPNGYIRISLTGNNLNLQTNWQKSDPVNPRDHFDYYRLLDGSNVQNLFWVGAGDRYFQKASVAHSFSSTPFVAVRADLQLAADGTGKNARQGYDIGFNPANNENYLLFQINNGRSLVTQWVRNSRLRRYGNRNNALSIFQGAKQYAFFINNNSLRVRVNDNADDGSLIQIVEYKMGFVPPDTEVFFSGNVVPPTDENVHFGGIVTSEGVNDIVFADDDIQTVDWQDFLDGRIAFTVANIPAGESHRLYWAVPEDPRTQRHFYGGPGESRPYSHMISSQQRTINSVVYTIWIFDADNSVDDSFNGEVIYAGGDR